MRGKKLVLISFVVLIFSSFLSYEDMYKAFASLDIESIRSEVQTWYIDNINNSTITAFGDPVLRPGLVGDAIYFDGNRSHLRIENINKGVTFTGFTLSAWVKPQHTKLPTDMTITNSKDFFDLSLVKSENKQFVEFSVFDGMKWIKTRSQNSIFDDWTNITATYDGRSLTIYINGKLDVSYNLQKEIRYFAYGKEVVRVEDIQFKHPIFSSDILIGGTQSSNGVIRSFMGSIDEVNFYLTPSSMLQAVPKLKVQNDYVLKADNCTHDQSIQCNIQIPLHTNNIEREKSQVTFSPGIITLNGVEYRINSKDWRGTIPIKSGQSTFSGFAFDANGNEIHVVIVGVFLENTLESHTYRMSGSIRGNVNAELYGQFDLVSLTNLYEEKVLKPKPPAGPPPILLMTKHFTTAMIGGYYKFDSKVYYFEENKLGNYYQSGGEVKNATMSLKITDKEGVLLKRFDGVSNHNGYFIGEFVVPLITKPGPYTVVVEAEKDGSKDINEMILWIVEQPKTSDDTAIKPEEPKELTITLLGSNPQIIQVGTSYVELGATAYDPEDGDISASIVIDSSGVNTAVVGTYAVTYSVVDSSGNSDVKTRTVNVVATVSGAPTNLLSNAISPSQINLSWNTPTNNGGSPITGYKIERESPIGGGWNTLIENTGSTSTTYQDTGLTPNTQYNYRVSAINSIGTGTTSNTASATTQHLATQYVRPDSDISKGGWTDQVSGNNNGILYDDIDETVRNDVDHVTSQSISASAPTDTMIIGMSDAQDPNRADAHVVKYVYRKNGTGGINLNLTVILLQGTTPIASWSHGNIGTSFTLTQQTLTESQANSISNYNDLRLQFTVERSGGGQARTASISWAEIQIG
jgi:hypothetical protein